MNRFASILITCAAIAWTPAAATEAYAGTHLSGHVCLIVQCPGGSTTKAAAAAAIQKFEATAPTAVTITECRHDRRLVVCFLTRPYEIPDSGIVAVEWWDCVGPRKIVTSSFTSERCQRAASRAFPEL